MAVASNRYLLNGIDLYDSYGYIISGGSNDLLRPPSMDEPWSHKFTDINGTKYDLSTPTFTHAQATLTGYLLGNSEANFWSNYDALFGFTGVLRTPGSKTLTVVEFGRVFEVFYREVPNIIRFTRLKEYTDLIKVRLDIRFEVLASYLISGLRYFYGGPVSSYPASWGAISALSNSPESNGSVFSFNTGTTQQSFAISIPNNRTIKRIIDLSASNVNLTSGFTLQTVVANPSGVIYNTYGLSQSIPYAVNHVYRVELN